MSVSYCCVDLIERVLFYFYFKNNISGRVLFSNRVVLFKPKGHHWSRGKLQRQDKTLYMKLGCCNLNRQQHPTAELSPTKRKRQSSSAEHFLWVFFSSKLSSSCLVGLCITMERGVQRWIVDISGWDPSPQDFSFALSVLPSVEQPSVTRFSLALSFSCCLFFFFGIPTKPRKKKTQ